jgi:phospholipid N-methyltransferase
MFFLKRIFNAKKYKQGAYISCEETVRGAQENKLSVCEYLEKLWDQVGATQLVIDNMENYGCFQSEKLVYVLEIGTGTGRYAEKVINKFSVDKYFSYETAEDWAHWLQETYGPKLISRSGDGNSLTYEQDGTIDLVHAHGVFVYLPVLHCFKYFTDMVRVSKKGGFIVFDFYPIEHFSLETINKWIESKDYYPVLIPENLIQEFFEKSGFALCGSFLNKYGHGFSKYHVYKNTN